MADEQEYEVAIVGYGPVGATLANLLGVAGIRTCVIEREASMYSLPRAGHFDDEVMRVFQAIGLADRVAETVRVNPGMRFVTATGATLVDWPRPQTIGPQGWYHSYRFHQPYVDAILRDGLSRFPSHAVYLSTEVTAVRESSVGAVLTCLDRQSGEARQISADYVVGCDGARSVVRRTMGVSEDALNTPEKWIVVDGKLRRERPDLGDLTLQYCDPRRPTTFIRMVEDRRRWEFMLMPDETEDAICHPDEVAELLRPWVRPDEIIVERAVVYTFQAVLANGWRKGRLFLAGDSAHRTPPFLGQGMCAGIRDAANLAWKLAAVIKIKAPVELLDSYEAERKPHVREYLELAIRLGGILQITDERKSAERDALLAKAPEDVVSRIPALGRSSLVTPIARSGSLSRQVRLGDGSRLDDAVGYRFGVIGNQSLLDRVSPASRERWRLAGAVVLPNEGGDYLADLGAGAAIIRPDRYFLGIARDELELDELSGLIPSARSGKIAA